MSAADFANTHGNSRREFALASFHTFFGTIVSRVLVFGLAIVTARILGSESYGEFAIVQSTVLLLALALGHPLSILSNRYSAALRVEDPQKASSLASSLMSATVVAGSLVAAGLWVGSSSLAERLFRHEGLAPFLATAAVAVIFQAFFVVATGTLRGFQEFKSAASAQALQALIGVPLALMAVWVWGLWGAVFGLIGFWAIGSALAMAGLGRLSGGVGISFGAKFEAAHLTSVGPFYFPYLLTVLCIVFSNWGVRTILTHGVDAYRQVGLFSAAFQYAQVSQLIVGPLMMVSTPMLTTAWSRSEHTRFRQTASDLLKVSYILIAPLALVAVGCAPWLLAWLGSDYQQALHPTEILFVALALNSLLGLIGPALIATERAWSFASLSLLRSGLLVLLAYLLRSKGALGASLSFLTTEIVIAFILLVSFAWRRELEIIKVVGRMLLFSLPGLVLGAIGVLQHGATRAMMSVAAGAFLALGTWLALGRADQASLLRLLGKLVGSSRRSVSGDSDGPKADTR